MNNLEKAKEFFSKDRFATEVTGIVIEEVSENYAKCSLKIKEHHKNAVGAVMGGVVFTLADFVFAVSTNFNQPTTVTTVSQICYISAAKGDTLYGESKLIKDGRTTCFYKISITDNLGNVVAEVTTTGNHLH